MRSVALVACGLIGGALMGCLSGASAQDKVPDKPRNMPIETAALTKPAAVAAIPPATSPTLPPTAVPAVAPVVAPAPAVATAPASTPPEAPIAAPAATPTPTAAKKDTCAGVIGTSRTIVADATLPQKIGLMQYKTSLPLKDHEVVLTFDDGPIHTYTPRVLDILAKNCVKATFFLVGSMAQAYPALVRREYNEGHSIGTHSQRHPLTFNRMTEPAVAREVDTGIASVEAAAGDPRAVAPFFRVPGLLRSKTVDGFLATHALSEWSADEVADDWHRGITPREIVRLAMKRIAGRDHRGVLLLHDIHPATAEALPTLLAELKAHGYHIVHVAPGGDRPKALPPLPEPVIAHAHPHKARYRHVARLTHHKSLRKHHRTRVQSLSARKHQKRRTAIAQTAAYEPEQSAFSR